MMDFLDDKNKQRIVQELVPGNTRGVSKEVALSMIIRQNICV